MIFLYIKRPRQPSLGLSLTLLKHQSYKHDIYETALKAARTLGGALTKQ